MENKDLQAIDDAVEKQAEVLVEQEMERQNVDSKSDGAKPAMKVKDLYFSYGKNKVLKGVSLQIAAGKITTIMGANGCGKSTLFSLMTKNLYPRKGNIFLSGKEDISLSRVKVLCHQGKQRGLSTSVCTHDGRDLSGCDLQGYTFQHFILPIGKIQIFHLHCRLSPITF